MKTLKESLQNSLDTINESSANYSKVINVEELDYDGMFEIPAADFEEFTSIKPNDVVLINSNISINFSTLELKAKSIHIFANERDIIISNLKLVADELCTKTDYSVTFENCDLKLKTLGLSAEWFDYDELIGSSKVQAKYIYIFAYNTGNVGSLDFDSLYHKIVNANEDDCVDREGSRYFEIDPAISDYTDLKNKKLNMQLNNLLGGKIPNGTIAVTVAGSVDDAEEGQVIVFTKDSSIEKKLAYFDDYSILSCPRWIKSGELAIITTLDEIKKEGLNYLICSNM